MVEATLEKERLVEGIVRLRRIAPELDRSGRAELDRVISLLEQAAGPTLSQSEVCRLLGVSHTTIRRRIEKGDIPTVPTPRGRTEISLMQAIRLLEAVERMPGMARKFALTRVMDEQRQRAADLDLKALLPTRLTRNVQGHRTAELRSLAYHRAVAQQLNQHVIAEAQRRLDRWQREGHIHPTWATVWQRVLALPAKEIARLISSDSQNARALRQSSPFAGTLSEPERRRLHAAVQEPTT